MIEIQCCSVFTTKQPSGNFSSKQVKRFFFLFHFLFFFFQFSLPIPYQQRHGPQVCNERQEKKKKNLKMTLKVILWRISWLEDEFPEIREDPLIWHFRWRLWNGLCFGLVEIVMGWKIRRQFSFFFLGRFYLFISNKSRQTYKTK